jgi:hypothetical protein
MLIERKAVIKGRENERKEWGRGEEGGCVS